MTEGHPKEHPEDWLDLAISGRLAPAERTLLDQHLAICGACAAHLKIAESFRSTGSLGSRDDRLDRWAVERAVTKLAYRPSPRSMWRLSPRWGWLFAAVLLFVATGVSAKLWIAKVSRSARVQSIPQIRQDQRAAVAQPQRRAQAAIAIDPALESLAPDEAHRVTERPSEPAQPRHSPQLTAAALFERARELGHAGKVDAALSVHHKLQRLYPHTAEAGLSFALVGRLLLDRNRPAEALVQFDRYLASGGAADEEALAGRAASLERLGRLREEKIAWRALLERHPGSVYADRARLRLQDTSTR